MYTGSENMKKKLLIVLIIIISIFGILKYKNYDIKNLINEGLVSINSKYGDLKSFISKGNLIKNSELAFLKDSNVDYSNYNVNITTSPYYNLLSNKEKDLYRQIYANADNMKKTFIPKQDITKDELDETITAVYNDSPELFWIDTSYSYKYLLNGKVAQVTLNYNSTANDIDNAKYLFNYSANKIIENANNYNTDFEKEKYVHDTIINITDYDSNEKLNQSAYSALVTGKTVCAGYTRAFQYIMNKLGIITYYITGKSEGQNHAWNIVKLESDYYNIDLTWDDQTSISYKYFNKTDEQFNESHERSTLSKNLPNCYGTKYLYKKKFINYSTNNYDEKYIEENTKNKSDYNKQNNYSSVNNYVPSNNNDEMYNYSNSFSNDEINSTDSYDKNDYNAQNNDN